MCGICGEYGRPDPLRVRGMAELLRHRGPDDEGFFEGPRIVLGSRRLSIIDLETGRQPMVNEDGTVIVVQNGEIYNFRELRRELEKAGHRFRSASDTEVIVHLYEEHGLEFARRLRGMFAIALWDASRERLVLVRDRLGVKPLYVCRNGEVLAFASELKALLGAGHAAGEVDPVAVAQYVGFPCVPAPRTILPGVRALRPGELVCFDGDGERSRFYWRLVFPRAEEERAAEEEGEDVWAERLREGLREAVRLRLVSDVPLGAFLSGGLDSSAVVSMMGTLLEHPVRTFSIAFSGADEGFAWFNELGYAQTVARRFGTRHTEMTVTPGDARRRLVRMIWAMDQPSGDALQYYLVSEVARSGVSVALSGTGGDEVFAGYEWFRELSEIAALGRRLRWIPDRWLVECGRMLSRLPAVVASRGPLRRVATLLRGQESFLARYRLNRRLYRLEELPRLLAPGILEALRGAGEEADELSEFAEDVEGRSVVAATSLLQLKTDMVNLLLRDQDAVSMAHSLEMRVPLIDHELVEAAARIPSSLKLRRGQEKYILRKALEGILPGDILERRKKGFMFPMHLWMRKELADIVRATLDGESVRRRGFFRPEAVVRLRERFFAGKEPFFKVWNLVALELWCRLIIDARVVEDPGLRPVEDLL
jgi:asparagine synthase (glutamine-hydrolysing)